MSTNDGEDLLAAGIGLPQIEQGVPQWSIPQNCPAELQPQVSELCQRLNRLMNSSTTPDFLRLQLLERAGNKPLC